MVLQKQGTKQYRSFTHYTYYDVIWNRWLMSWFKWWLISKPFTSLLPGFVRHKNCVWHMVPLERVVENFEAKRFQRIKTFAIVYWPTASYFKVTLTPHSFIAFRELNTSFLVRLPISLADRLQFGKHGLHAEYEIAASQSGSRKTLSSFSTINQYSFVFFRT